jgi:hypothetical protein
MPFPPLTKGPRARALDVLALCALAGSVAACAAEPAAESAPPLATVASGAAATDSTPRPGTGAPVAAPTADTARAARQAADAASGGVSDSARRAPAANGASTETRELTRALHPSRTKRDTISFLSAIRAGTKAAPAWPTGPAPAPGAILPAKRIVAFYGNPLSKRMGVLGEYPVDDMLARLDREVARWQKADPSTPVQPALHLVTVVAQGAPGRDGKYRLRMDSALIEKVYGWARSRDALLFLDIQVGHSTVEQELPRLLPFLERPDIHLGLDPEFSMHYDRAGIVPGRKIGTMMARDVNHAVRTLSDLVARKGIPPKVLVVHRFTRRMVPDAESIRLDPRVQVVMDMDGWGAPWLKFDSYRDYIVAHPVQFTGFKLFYHNDTKKGDALLTPDELLRLAPRPGYIQYQ